jgi:hypothetical protein
MLEVGGNSQSEVVWKIVPLCIMWCLWRERNDGSFENLERTLEELKSFFFFPHLLGQLLIYLVISFSEFLVLFSLSS